ncbi:MAG TPA: hypothetical protein V6D47_09215 [Oscillatoriaceae cyanobacterium]
MTAISLEAACAPYRSLAIAGMAKNAGKTTALNYLIARFAAAGDKLGLSSIGRDGEAIDQITNRPKPRIHPPVGTLVATSHESALYSQATLRRIATTSYRTALGPVGIYEVLGPGYVEVAGPVKVNEAAALVRQLVALGCTRVLLDGAADRRAFVSAGVEAFVLSSGLAVAPDPAAAAAETAAVLARLQLPAPPGAWRAQLDDLDSPGALGPSGWHAWVHESFLSGLDAFASWLPPDAEAIYVPGAFGDGLAEALLTQEKPLGVVLPAGTHLLVARPLLERLVRRGYRFYALRPLRAVAVTVNPTSPDGARVAPDVLLEAFARVFPDLPIIDVAQTAGPH